MTDEDFLSRWSRRKRAAEEEPAKAPAEPPAAGDAGRGDEAGPAEPTPEEEFDLASLPPIESIGSASDVTVFLRKGVPSDLTRAALRRAWVADPAIRDFIGLAENAWDFNDPNAMPGFGPLDQSPEEVRQLVSQLFGETRSAVEEMIEAPGDPAPAAESVSNSIDLTPPPAENDVSVPVQEPDTAKAAPAELAEPRERAATISAVHYNEKQEETFPPRRSHGGALPR